MPRIGTSAGGRSVSSRGPANATAKGSGDSFSTSITVRPPRSGDATRPAAPRHRRGSAPGSRRPGCRRCVAGGPPAPSAGTCQRSSAATNQDTVAGHRATAGRSPSRTAPRSDRHGVPVTPTMVGRSVRARRAAHASNSPLRLRCISAASASGGRSTFVTDRDDLFGDRHLDTVPAGEVEHAGRRLDALGDHVGAPRGSPRSSAPRRAAGRPCCCGSASTSTLRSGRPSRRARRTSPVGHPSRRRDGSSRRAHV